MKEGYLSRETGILTGISTGQLAPAIFFCRPLEECTLLKFADPHFRTRERPIWGNCAILSPFPFRSLWSPFLSCTPLASGAHFRGRGRPVWRDRRAVQHAPAVHVPGQPADQGAADRPQRLLGRRPIVRQGREPGRDQLAGGASRILSQAVGC
jgi:hypothetical protein